MRLLHRFDFAGLPPVRILRLAQIEGRKDMTWPTAGRTSCCSSSPRVMLRVAANRPGVRGGVELDAND